MTMLAIKNLLFKNFNLKVVACVIGYGLWYITSQSLVIERTFTIPVAFYNAHNTLPKGPEAFSVTLKGKKSTLRKIAANLAVHIDASRITQEKPSLTITKEDLFLPDTVSLVHYTPTDSLIHIAC